MKFSRSSLVNLSLLALLLFVLLNTDARAGVIRGLMHLGLYTPETQQPPSADAAEADDVQFKDGQGQLLSLKDLKGKVVFINFWATWCPPCRAEMPSIHKLYKQFRNNKNMVFITVDADSDYAKARKFLDRRKYDWPLYTVAGELPRQLFGGMLPTTVLLDKSGNIVFRQEGAADYAHPKFIKMLDDLIR